MKTYGYKDCGKQDTAAEITSVQLLRVTKFLDR
jgi:hypothetical protein